MTATTNDLSLAHPSRTQVLLDVIRCEWTKLRTLRSTYWSALAAVVVAIGISALVCLGNSTSNTPPGSVTDPTGLSLAGLFLAQIAFAIVGVLSMSAEYTSGMIRTTLSAVPQRGYILAGKAIVVGTASFLLALITSFVSFWLGQAILSRRNFNIDLSAPGVLRTVIGAALYTLVLVLLAMSLATILRNTAGTITSIVVIVFVLPAVVAFLPLRWQDDLGRYLPANAGGSIVSIHTDNSMLRPWPGFAVFCAWGVLTGIVAWWTLRRRDV